MGKIKNVTKSVLVQITASSLLLSGCGQPGQISERLLTSSFPKNEVMIPEIQMPEPLPLEPITMDLEKSQHSQEVVIQETAQTDVLIVIDNSASMRFEQANMADRFGSLLDEMKSLDWRLGIITTDLSANAPKKDGRLLEFKGLPDTFVLTSSMPEDVIKTAFAGTIQRPSREGNSNEQGIKATYRALERKQELFRSEGSLNVVVVTDADETPVKGSKPDARNQPTELIKYVDSLYPGKPFYFHSIIVKENDEACLKVDDNESYGRAYAWLSEKTGGVIGSVCEQDYSTQLKMIGEKVSQKVKSVELQCAAIVESVKVSNSLNLPIPAHHLEGKSLIFDGILPNGTNRIDYECDK